MDEVTLDKKKYIKASTIAKHLGYTSDYVGQLCRSGKVDAQLVGRSWFVAEDSLREYKHGTKRSNVAKSKAAVKHYQHIQREDTTPASRASTHHLEVQHYEADENDLFPQVRKATTAPDKAPDRVLEAAVVAATAPVPLKIRKNSKVRNYTATERPPVRFNGTVSVTEAMTPAVRPKIATPAEAPKSKPAQGIAQQPGSPKVQHLQTYSSDEEYAVEVHITGPQPIRRTNRLLVVSLQLVFFVGILLVLTGVSAVMVGVTDTTGDAIEQTFDLNLADILNIVPIKI